MAKKIVIDAGHAEFTAGNQTPDGIYEWTLNNKVALAVAKRLDEYEVEIYRTDDITGRKDVSLADRIKKANEIKPDVLVSIHHNAYNSKWGTHSGVEAYYNLNRRNDKEKALASEVAAAMSKNTGLMNRGAKTAAFYMLTGSTDYVSILTEGGFMDSTIDHPIIVSAKGQDNYAKAIADALIAFMNLQKKKIEVPVTSLDKAKVGGKVNLPKNTTGYYTAADAAAGKDARVNVTAGDYWVYTLASGMVNITKTSGYPGSWINPNGTTVATPPPTTPAPQTPKVGGKYTLSKSVAGYYTAADAVAKKNERVTVLAGEYTIYNMALDMLNVTKVANMPGSWINPETNGAPTTPVIGGKYTITKSYPGYYTSTDALNKQNQKATLTAGEYYIFNIANGMLNLTKVKNEPGSWMNPK